MQPQNPPQQSFEQIEVEEVVEEVSKETKKGKKKKSKKVDKEKKEQERREKNEQEAKEKEREKKENREAGVDYVDEFHGPWEVSIKMVEATYISFFYFYFFFFFFFSSHICEYILTYCYPAIWPKGRTPFCHGQVHQTLMFV